METESSRCSGHCCHSFALDLSPAEVLREAKRSRGNPFKEQEAKQLAEMLIYHGRFRTNPILKTKRESWAKKGLLIAQREDDKHVAVKGETSHWYGCRHIQLNGDCGIYETRPMMCRSYPDGRECLFEDCTRKSDDFVEELTASIKLVEVKSLTKKVRPKR